MVCLCNFPPVLTLFSASTSHCWAIEINNLKKGLWICLGFMASGTFVFLFIPFSLSWDFLFCLFPLQRLSNKLLSLFPRKDLMTEADANPIILTYSEENNSPWGFPLYPKPWWSWGPSPWWRTVHLGPSWPGPCSELRGDKRPAPWSWCSDSSPWKAC